ncbi:unnamed protein product [Leptidea sinapis]|uniref:Uncharacterized protein n=1 Tax=Leptidea sinapis TaxID=189913 RepID=A0A5E4Q954_9NEOP|nr:unnamed protein product [Leptidea sinapis]
MMTSENSVLTQLNVTGVKVEDGGVYTCSARDGDSIAAHESRIDVKIDWEHNGKIITSDLFRYKRSITNIQGTLHITEVNDNDQYTCVVTSPSGEMARRTFDVQVVEAPVIEDLMLANNIQEGQIIVERNSESFSALVIKRVALEHCGTYTCVATNHVAAVNKSTDLYIKVAPKWLLEPSNSSLLLGSQGTISCSASGYPTPQVHWMKKDGTLGTWQPVLELAGGVLSLANGTLVIEEVSLSDEGMYSCNIENGVGVPLSKTIWISVNKPAHFETSSSNITVLIDQPLTLECKSYGDHPLSIQWTHGKIHIDIHNRHTISEEKTEAGLTSTLYLSQVETVHDGGLYQCKASNPYGTAVFNIFVTVLDEANTKLIKLLSTQSGKQETIIGGLLKNTRYAVSLSAFNNAGFGPFSAAVFQDTKEGAPDVAPSSPECTGISSTSLRISWQSLTASLTHLTGYIIAYSALETTEQNQTSSHTEVYLQSLRKYTNYSIRVAAYSMYGVGPFSIPINCATLQDVPGSPAAIKVLVATPTSLLVSWKSPDEPNGEILGGTTEKATVTADIKTSEIKDLVTGRTYELWVCAATVMGEGAPSVRVKQTPSSRAYNLTWKEANKPWHEAWSPMEFPDRPDDQKYTISGLKCGTKYSLRITARNKVGLSQPAYMEQYTDYNWNIPYMASYRSSSFISNLSPATWYQVRVTATNEAGSATSAYEYATKNLDGSEVSPPLELLDINLFVISVSSALLLICLVCCVYLLINRQM